MAFHAILLAKLQVFPMSKMQCMRIYFMYFIKMYVYIQISIEIHD